MEELLYTAFGLLGLLLTTIVNTRYRSLSYIYSSCFFIVISIVACLYNFFLSDVFYSNNYFLIKFDYQVGFIACSILLLLLLTSIQKPRQNEKYQFHFIFPLSLLIIFPIFYAHNIFLSTGLIIFGGVILLYFTTALRNYKLIKIFAPWFIWQRIADFFLLAAIFAYDINDSATANLAFVFLFIKNSLFCYSHYYIKILASTEAKIRAYFNIIIHTGAIFIVFRNLNTTILPDSIKQIFIILLVISAIFALYYVVAAKSIRLKLTILPFITHPLICALLYTRYYSTVPYILSLVLVGIGALEIIYDNFITQKSIAKKLFLLRHPAKVLWLVAAINLVAKKMIAMIRIFINYFIGHILINIFCFYLPVFIFNLVQLSIKPLNVKTPQRFLMLISLSIAILIFVIGER